MPINPLPPNLVVTFAPVLDDDLQGVEISVLSGAVARRPPVHHQAVGFRTGFEKDLAASHVA